MNQFLKQVFILFTLLSSINLLAQEDISVEEKKKSFEPKFSIGSGIYTLTGDIQNQDVGILKGKAGFNAGMKFDISENIDLSCLVFKTSFSADNNSENFTSDVDGFGVHLGYGFNSLFKQSKITPMISLGVQRLSASTTIMSERKERFNALVAPIVFGLRMDITDRLQFDIAMNFGMGLSDIDMSQENRENSDGYKSLNFTIHYDFFTRKKNVDDNLTDDYYADVDFLKLEAEDEDSDLVLDMDDYCPNTPIGVKVDKNGCPLDDDKDGIANYLDKQNNTPLGSIVDEKGVRLTDDKYKSMYSDLESATRKYANFYNELEIKRENYKTVDEYLIAKANAFNKAFNERVNENMETLGLFYKVKIGEFEEGIPAKIINQLLSLDDLESFVMDDGTVIYAVGIYSTLDEAMSRLYEVEKSGFDDTYILVDNNGIISDYVEPVIDNEIDEEELVDIPKQDTINTEEIVPDTEESLEIAGSISKDKNSSTNGTTYRIQIGAFNKPLSEAVFVGVDNVISFTGRDGLIRYMAGSFIKYKEAIDYQAQMKARGFEDAFIVTYKDGKRISLDVAIEDTKNNVINKTSKAEKKDKDINVSFTVQIMVGEVRVSADDLLRMSKLSNFDKKAKGSDMYEYYAGTYSNLEEANIQLEKAKEEGFSDAFIFATKQGKRIPIVEALELLK